MKRLITSSDRYTPKGSYLYIFKHGIGPGTIPSDVSVIKTKDLPNYYTAVWLDRFLTADELKQYDIPSETEINRYLDRIGYCQKNGDVVPCDEVNACDSVMASSDIDGVSFRQLELIKEGKFPRDFIYGLSVEQLVRFYYAWEHGQVDELYKLMDDYGFNYEDDDVEACDKVLASDDFDDDEDKIYWVQAYYSKPHKGLADDFATNDWDEAIDKLVEYANDGNYVLFENLASGEGYEYDPDEVLAAVESGDIYTLRRLNSLYEG